MNLSSTSDNMNVKMGSTGKPFKNVCITQDCRKVYLWATESLQMEMYFQEHKGKETLVAYEAELVVTKAINVCGLRSRNCALGIASGDSVYIFAPDATFETIPPNDVTCEQCFNYSLSVPSPSTLTLLNVTAVACPTDTSCASVLLNELSCIVGKTVTVPQNGLTVHYVHHKCNNSKAYSGFIVRVQYGVPVERPLESTTGSFETMGHGATSKGTACKSSQAVLDAVALTTQHTGAVATTGSILGCAISSTVAKVAQASSSPPQLFSTARSEMLDFVISSSSPNATDDRFRTGYVTDAIAMRSSAPNVTVSTEQKEPDAADPLTVTLLVATFTVLAVGALAIGITVALLCRRRRLLAQLLRSNVTNEARSLGQANGGGVAMVENDLYGETRKNLPND